MALFNFKEYNSDLYGQKEHFCPFCDSSDLLTVQVYPWQLIATTKNGERFAIAEGEDLECFCRDCGGKFFCPGNAVFYYPEYIEALETSESAE